MVWPAPTGGAQHLSSCSWACVLPTPTTPLPCPCMCSGLLSLHHTHTDTNVWDTGFLTLFDEHDLLPSGLFGGEALPSGGLGDAADDGVLLPIDGVSVLME